MRTVKFLTAVTPIWEYIEKMLADKIHGEWHAKLKPDGPPWTAPDPDACLMIHRLPIS
jgi:mannobiose 2-epimerase